MASDSTIWKMLKSILAKLNSGLSITNLPTTQPVSGTVAVNNFPAAGLTDAELRASPVPVEATIDTTGLMTSAVVSEAPPSYLPTEERPLSLTTEGRLRVSSQDARLEPKYLPDTYENLYTDRNGKMYPQPSGGWRGW